MPFFNLITFSDKVSMDVGKLIQQGRQAKGWVGQIQNMKNYSSSNIIIVDCRLKRNWPPKFGKHSDYFEVVMKKCIWIFCTKYICLPLSSRKVRGN